MASSTLCSLAARAASRTSSTGLMRLGMARRVVPSVPRLARGLAADVSVPDTSGRTPERTAELERLAEEHNGFLFGEVPPPEGQSRQWEDWEYSYTPMMCSAFLIYGLAFYYRCVACAGGAALFSPSPQLPSPPSTTEAAALHNAVTDDASACAVPLCRPRGSATDVAREEALARNAEAAGEEDDE